MANKTIVINNKTYPVPELDNNALCDLADLGVDIFSKNFKKKSAISVARGLIAWIEGVDIEDAGNELQAHILAGGDMAAIFTAFNEAVDDSGFIKAMASMAQNSPATPQDHLKKNGQRR